MRFYWVFVWVVLGWGTLGLGAEARVEGFPVAGSKKGLQVEDVGDALALGVKHAALNFNLAQLIDPHGDTNNPGWMMGGKWYRFQRGYVEGMDRQVKALSDHGVLVYMIVLAYESHDREVNRLLLHPGYATNAPNRLGAFNTVSEEGRAWLRASFEFVAARWSRPDGKFGRAVGYIMGNEVNSHWYWSNMGRVSMEQFAEEYLRATRIAQEAVRKECAWARVYVSLEHHWNIRYPAGSELESFAGRPFLEYFARRAREQGDFDWHLAFHPYPENLFEPRFWNDKSATTNADTPRITFKNLGMLTDFMKRPEMMYQGKPRRVILSEQGFHTPKGVDGEMVQAAAYCYAYKKVEALEGIDAFILHRHVDHPAEGGLLLGLRGLTARDGDPHPKKKSYEVFRQADTPGWEKAFEFALPVVGLRDWGEAR